MTDRSRRVLIGLSYLVLGATLVFSRLVGLDKSYWFDEVVTVTDFVRAGPRHIIAGSGISHELYSLLAWATASTIGESEAALRMWSAVPFIAGAAVVTIWLHRRLSPIAGLLFLFLATTSPLLLDISRQARGYGLAFFAMSLLVVGALEATQSARNAAIAAMLVGGVVGSWTLPQFTIAFVATIVVVALDPGLRTRVVVGGLIACAAVAAWYAPHLAKVHEAAIVDNGVQIDGAWILTAPFDQVLLPTLLWIEGMVLFPGVTWVPLAVLAALVMASSPYVRDLRTSLVLCAGPMVTIIFFWAVQAYYWPRYLSFLVVPMFVLLSSGGAAVLERLTSRPAVLRTVVVVVAVCFLAVNFASVAPDVMRLPRQANRNAAELIETRGSTATPVLTYMTGPRSIVFYLGRRVDNLDGKDVATGVCRRPVPVAYVMEPFGVPPVDVPCLRGRPGVTHYRFDQYAGGHQMNVWFVPPAT
jgi:hypothetical protein